MTALYVPELDPDAGTIDAAVAYIAAGWYVLPIDSTTKHAGSVLGKGWPAKSSRDPKQIVAWFAGSKDGIALHVGRSGAVVFDVDAPEEMPLILSDTLFPLDPPHQSSRVDAAGRGHYLFAVPPGRNFSNGAGKLRGGWGEVRGRNGIIVVFPTPHSKGGRYTWVTTGVLPELPNDLAELLPESTDADSAATDTETVEFLAAHTQSTNPELVDKLFEKIDAQYKEGTSRHSIFVDVTSWAMRESMAGLYPAIPVANRLRGHFVAWMGTARNASERTLDASLATSEFMGILAWAVAQAKQSDVDDVLREVNGRMAPAPLMAALTGMTPL